MNTIELWMIEQGYAQNQFQANAIYSGALLADLLDEGEQKARVALYRNWRKSGLFGKDTRACFEKAIAGEKVPMLPVEVVGVLDPEMAKVYELADAEPEEAKG